MSDGLNFYQSWLLLDEPGDRALMVFHEGARGPAALLRTADRSELTGTWLHALGMIYAWR